MSDFRRINATGRSTTRYKEPGRKSKSDNWVKINRTMLESAAWRALSLSARRALDRLLLEHMMHAGKENGRLPCTFSDFTRYGIDRHAVEAKFRARFEATGGDLSAETLTAQDEQRRADALRGLSILQSTCEADVLARARVLAVIVARDIHEDEAQDLAWAVLRDLDPSDYDWHSRTDNVD